LGVKTFGKQTGALNIKSTSHILLCTLLLAAVAAAVVEWNTIANLRLENLELKNQVQQTRALAESDLNQKLAQLKGELDQLRAQARELPRLRGEAQQLRKSINELARLRDENQQLKARSAAASSAASHPPDSGETSVKRENWAFAGYASPDAALQSTIWAASQGDLKTMLAASSPEFRTEMEKEWENKTEAQIAQELRKETEKIAAYRILDRETVSDDEVVLNVYTEGNNRAKKLSMKKYGNEWKFAGPPKP
jgi:Domain of unknown function (DUF4878)